ncbi:MAG: hypothetical protein JSS11_15340 [Verrucomicrobia bacterium]|nr:hypothetical protein [Verrucomicrobiota bacterium]
MPTLTKLRTSALVILSALALTGPLQAWDYVGHRIVNQLGLASLPADFPAFVKTPGAAERIAFLAGEPDRWRNGNDDLPLKNYNGVDHYWDLEEITDAGLKFDQLSSLRYEYAVQFANGRAAHPENFPAIDQTKNTDHAREWAGFTPWAIREYYGKLRSAFSYLKALEEYGTPEEVANAQANIIYIMGIMGHYVGDSAQPLHTTVHHHGWVGANPHGYSTWSGIHAWIDGGFIAKAHIKTGDMVPRVKTAEPISLAARADGRDPMFVAAMDFMLEQNKMVEPLYQLEKAGKFNNSKGNVEPASPEGRAFIEGQLLKGGELLGAIWVTAWRSAPPDTYLRAELIKRKAAAEAHATPKTAP